MTADKAPAGCFVLRTYGIYIRINIAKYFANNERAKYNI